MGRRKSLFDHIIDDISKSNARAVSDQRRRAIRAESESARDRERRRVRESRENERSAVARERAGERERIRAERDYEKRRKQEEKLAQAETWAAEVDDHNDRDESLMGIANSSPEVEDRSALFESLLVPTPFQPPPFAPPPLPDPQSNVQALRRQFVPATFQPPERSPVTVIAGLGFGVFSAVVFLALDSPYLAAAAVAIAVIGLYVSARAAEAQVSTTASWRIPDHLA